MSEESFLFFVFLACILVQFNFIFSSCHKEKLRRITQECHPLWKEEEIRSLVKTDIYSIQRHALIFNSVFLWLTIFVIGNGDFFDSNVHLYNHKYLPKQVLNHVTYTDFFCWLWCAVAVQNIPKKHTNNMQHNTSTLLTSSPKPTLTNL